MSQKAKKKARLENAVAARSYPIIPSLRNQSSLFILFLFAATLLAYLPVWHAGFIWDDDYWLAGNALTKDPHGWYHFWLSTKTANYYPLTSTAFWLEWRLWGTNAAGYHVVNVLIHATNAVLLWRLLARLEIPGAKLAAAIFALHPVNVEAVAWITEMKDTLAMLFVLPALLSYLKFEDTRLYRWYWISVGTFVLALLSKSAVAPLPLVLLGIAWWRHGRVERKDLVHSAAFFGVAGVLALLTIWFESHNAIGHEIVRMDGFWSRLAIAGRAVWFYLYKAIVPINLISVYPRWPIGEVSVMSFVPGLLLAAVFFVCWRYRATWGRGPLFGLGCFVAMLLPVLGFLNLYYFLYSLVADQWQYFAIAGVIALAAAGITKALGPFPGAKIIVCGTLLAVLGALTWRQAEIYRDPETLWRATLAQNSRCWIAHNNLGYALLHRGAIEEAIPQFQQSLQIYPYDALAHNNLGAALFQKGKVDEAITQFQQALQAGPDSTDAHNNLGAALFQKGKVDEAIAQYQQALQIDPGYATAHYSLGNALLHKGAVDEAITQFQQALKINPDLAPAHNDLGNALLHKGAMDEAITQYQQALQLDPGYAVAHDNLGSALLQKGVTGEAIAQFQLALRINPDDVEAHNNLGSALLQNGVVDEGIAQFQQVLQINPDDADAHYNLANALHQKGKVDEAIIHLQKAVEINPGFLEAHYDLGLALVQQGKTDEAIIHFQKALALAQAAGQTNIVERLNAELKSLRP